jgi:hypothetical protein
MMSTYTKLVADAGDQYLAALAEGQQQFLKAASTLASAPAVSPVPTPAFAAELPTPREIADANFAFAAKLLEQQKAFTEKLFALGTATS